MGEHRHQERSLFGPPLVERLIAPHVINTTPRQTLDAFAQHANVERALDSDLSEILAEPAGSGVDLWAVTAELEREGVASFCDSCRELLDCIQTKDPEEAA
jgi:transaldolase